MPEAEEVDDRRAALSAAFDKAEAGPEEAAPEPAAATQEAAPAPEAKPEPAQPAEGRARDELGRFAPGTAKGEAAPQKPEAKAQDGVATPPGPPIGQPATPPAPVPEPWAKAPQSWKPEAREKYGNAPPEVQQEIHRRERETQIALQRASETHRSVEPLLRAVQPYAQQLSQRGMDPAQVVGNFLRTEQALSNPDVNVRARVIAEALSTYRIPVEALAAALDGTVAPGGQQAIDPQTIIQQAKESFRAELQQQQTQRNAQSASQEIEAFAPQAEFLEDVRDTTAAILQAAVDRGVAITLKEAYEQACWADPKIRGIYQQREASKKAATGAQATQRAHAAASSVKSSPGGAGGNGAPPDDSWRSHIRAAQDAADKQ